MKEKGVKIIWIIFEGREGYNIGVSIQWLGLQNDTSVVGISVLVVEFGFRKTKPWLNPELKIALQFVGEKQRCLVGEWCGQCWSAAKKHAEFTSYA